MMNNYHTILVEGNGRAVKLCQNEAVVKVHVLIRGDLFDMQLERAALQMATSAVIKEESAEAIVARS